MLPISKAVLKEEINLALRVLNKWDQKMDAGIPGVEFPAAEDQLHDFLRELCGEFMLLSGKLENIADIISNAGED